MYKVMFKIFKRAGLMLVLSTSTAVFAAKNDHPHFKLTPNKQLEQIKPTSKVQTNLSNPATKPTLDELHYDERNPTNSAVIVDTASFDLSRLMPAKVMSLDPSKPSITLPDPKISINGRDFTLSVVESVADPKQLVRYVTAKIVDHKGQARFIIDDAAGEVVGNIEIDGDTYRVLPREINLKQQLIYKFKRNVIKKGLRAKPIFVSNSRAKSVSRLEGELLKTELIHSINPTTYREERKNSGRRIKIARGNIGRLDIEKILKNDVSEVSDLLFNLDVITGSKSHYKYRLDKVRGSSKQGYSLDFRQEINGIPLRTSSRLTFDGEGNIKDLNALILDPEIVEIKTSNYTEEEVLQIANNAVKKYTGREHLTFITLANNPTNVGYKLIGENYTLTPYWDIVLYGVESGADSYRVRVDGNDGEVSVRGAAVDVTTQFQTDVCEHESGLSLPACEDVNITIPMFPPITIFSTVKDVIEESSSGQFICKLSGLCQDPQAKNPWEVINNMEDWLSESTGGICCAEVGGITSNIDVKINTEDSGPKFHPNSSGGGTVLFPHPANLDSNTFDPVQSQTIDDIVVHEVTHGVLRDINPNLKEALNDGDSLARALDEGFSDAMAVLYSEKFDPPGNTVIGDGLFKNSSDLRDISQSKTFDDFVDSTAPGMEHTNGRIFGNFIYRARQQGLSIDQAAKVIVWIASTVNRDGGLIGDKLDQKDIKNAIDDISDIDQIIGAILEAVWGQMNGYEDPPSGGGGSGTPFAPSYVTGLFAGCNGTISLYTNSWGASSGASFYQLYYSPTGAGYIYSFSTIFSGASTANTIDAFVKIKACNSSGCSGLSSSTFFQPHLCGG